VLLAVVVLGSLVLPQHFRQATSPSIDPPADPDKVLEGLPVKTNVKVKMNADNETEQWMCNVTRSLIQGDSI
jgi:hypothetical protein